MNSHFWEDLFLLHFSLFFYCTMNIFTWIFLHKTAQRTISNRQLHGFWLFSVVLSALSYAQTCHVIALKMATPFFLWNSWVAYTNVWEKSEPIGPRPKLKLNTEISFAAKIVRIEDCWRTEWRRKGKHWERTCWFSHAHRCRKQPNPKVIRIHSPGTVSPLNVICTVWIPVSCGVKLATNLCPPKARTDDVTRPPLTKISKFPLPARDPSTKNIKHIKEVCLII